MPGSRLFAALYDLLAGSAEQAMAPRREFVAGGAKGQVLEIGAGTGANLPYYRFVLDQGVPHPNPLPWGEGTNGRPQAGEGVTDLTLSDFSPHMLRRVRRKLDGNGVQATVVQAGAESLPFEDASFDTVVATLVLCSVRDQSKALREVLRVLKPGGEFRFFEHVRAGNGCWAAFQTGVKPLWRIIADGCEPNRDTVAAIRRAGFKLAELENYRFGPYPVRPHVMGVARRP